MPTSRGAEIGKRIRVARELAKLRVIELAQALDVVPMSIYRYETGKRVPTLELLERIALACGVELDWLLTGKGRMRAGAAA
jgi:transcriptional regulator with XRE-family HTH domain